MVLTITGAEALYADMGHFGRRPIPRARMAIVLPSLLLCYAGQAALVLEDPAPQYRIILVARKEVANGAVLKQLADAYKSADYRKFIETDPKAKGFSRPEYWR